MTRYRPLLGWLHLGLGVVTLLPLVILPIVLGGVWSVVAVASGDPEATTVVGLTFGVVMLVALVALGCSGLVSIAAGIGILQRRTWGDVLGVVASVLNLVHVPVGTALGVFGLWVLLLREPNPRLGVPMMEPQPDLA